MQDLLGNIFAGLALQFGKAFKDGDWLFVNNKYAKVIDINWRSTRLLTNDEISIDIPNRDMAKQTIINLNLPDPLHAMRISVNVDYRRAPSASRMCFCTPPPMRKGSRPIPGPASI